MMVTLTEEEKKLILATGIAPNRLQPMSKEEFLDRFPIDLRRDVTFPLRLLREAYVQRSSEDVWAAIALEAFAPVPEEYHAEHVALLCKLLLEDWHRSHETIASFLDYYRDPSSVDCLYQAALASFEYLAWDDNYSLAVKCVWALYKIGTESAREKLILLSGSDNPVIQENAQERLEEWEEDTPT